MSEGPGITRETLIKALADVFSDPDRARLLALGVDFPERDLPAFKTPAIFWSQVVRDLSHGKTKGGIDALVHAAAEQYPGNKTFSRYRAQAGTGLDETEASPTSRKNDQSRTSISDPCQTQDREPWGVGAALAMLSVDIMRLFLVQFGDVTHRDNRDRIEHFESLADERLRVLDLQLTSFASALSSENRKEAHALRANLGSSLIGVKNPTHDDATAQAIAKNLGSVTHRIEQLLSRVDPGRLSEISQDIQLVTQQAKTLPHSEHWVDKFARNRLQAQGRYIEQTPRPRTIAEDFDYGLAVPYMLIDKWVLNAELNSFLNSESPNDDSQTQTIEQYKATLIRDPSANWGLSAANESQRPLVDQALDLIPAVDFRRVASVVADRGKPETLGHSAGLEAIVAAVARRLGLGRFEVHPEDVDMLQRLMTIQIGELITQPHTPKVYVPHTRRDLHEWFATAWSFSLALPKPETVNPKDFPWQFPGWQETLDLDELPGQFPRTYLPPKELTPSMKRMMLLSSQVVGKLGPRTLSTAPRLMLPAVLLTEELYDRIEAKNLSSLKGSWEERHLVERIKALPAGSRLPLANLAWKLAGQTEDTPDSVASRILWLKRRLSHLGPLLLAAVDPAELAKTTCDQGTHTHSAPLAELLTLTREQRHAVLDAWHRRPPTVSPDWLEADELMSMFESDDLDLDLVIKLTNESTEAESREFARYVWEAAPPRALQESRRAFRSRRPSAAGWFQTAPPFYLATLLDIIEDSDVRPNWLSDWAESRMQDGSDASERLYALSKELRQP